MFKGSKNKQMFEILKCIHGACLQLEMSCQQVHKCLFQNGSLIFLLLLLQYRECPQTYD